MFRPMTLIETSNVAQTTVQPKTYNYVYFQGASANLKWALSYLHMGWFPKGSNCLGQWFAKQHHHEVLAKVQRGTGRPMKENCVCPFPGLTSGRGS